MRFPARLKLVAVEARVPTCRRRDGDGDAVVAGEIHEWP